MIMGARAAGLLASVDQDIDIGLGVVMEAMGAEGSWIAQVVAEQIRIPQQLFEMLTDFLDAIRTWFIPQTAAGVSDEILQAIEFFQGLG
jgi:hypothetical protein